MKTTISAFVSLGLLFFVALGCNGIGDETCGIGPKASMLKSMLNAGNNDAFNRRLSEHGAITEDELPCILSAIDSWSSTKRQNGARLLPLVGGDRNVLLEAQEKVVLETDDVFVWAKIMDTLLGRQGKANPAEHAAKRHDMIKKALSDEDGFIQSVGLKAGAIAKYPGIDAEIEKRLESTDPKLLDVALDALSPEKARSELTRLLGMLEEYETGSRYSGINGEVYFFVPLLNALIRTEDPKAFQSVRNALEKDYVNPGRVRGTRKELRRFRNFAAAIRSDSSMKTFCYYLIEEKSVAAPTGIDILTTPIWTGREEPTPEIVKICVETIRSGNLDTKFDPKFKYKPEQTYCRRFFKYLETGKNPTSPGGKTKVGADAVEIGRKWLKEHE